MDIVYMKTKNGYTNDSDFVHEDFIRQNPGISIPYLILICVFTINGCVGNVLVIASVLLYKPLRTVGNLFIVNLGLADLCVTGFVNPFSIIGIIKGELWFEYRPALCTAIASICVVSCFCSLSSILAISINRYVHICRNQIYKHIYTPRSTLLMCCGLWILCCLIEIPNHFGWNDHRFDRKNLGCFWDRQHPSPYFYIALGSAVGIPIIIVIFCYYRIYVLVKRSKYKFQSASQGAQREKRDSLKLTKTLCIVFVVFVTCWVPYTAMAIADRKDIIPLPIHLYSLLFAHLNSSVNCVIYGLTNRQFRIAYRKLLGMANGTNGGSISGIRSN